MYAIPAVSVLVCLTLYEADRWNPGSDKRKIKNPAFLPICSMMHTMIDPHHCRPRHGWWCRWNQWVLPHVAAWMPPPSLRTSHSSFFTAPWLKVERGLSALPKFFQSSQKFWIKWRDIPRGSSMYWFFFLQGIIILSYFLTDHNSDPKMNQTLH